MMTPFRAKRITMSSMGATNSKKILVIAVKLKSKVNQLPEAAVSIFNIPWRFIASRFSGSEI